MQKTIQLNGNSFHVPAKVSTVDQLLHQLELNDRIVIIEKNELIIDKESFDHPIMDGDRIEIIHFVGGG